MHLKAINLSDTFQAQILRSKKKYCNKYKTLKGLNLPFVHGILVAQVLKYFPQRNRFFQHISILRLKQQANFFKSVGQLAHVLLFLPPPSMHSFTFYFSTFNVFSLLRRFSNWLPGMSHINLIGWVSESVE